MPATVGRPSPAGRRHRTPPLLARPANRVRVRLPRIDGDGFGRELVADRGSPNGWTPIPIRAVAGPTSRPKISLTQISAERVGMSPKPIIHSATMFAGSSIARSAPRTARIAGCKARRSPAPPGRRARRGNATWPRLLPSDPEKTPVWSDDAFVHPSNSELHGSWSASIRRRRPPPTS